MVKEKVRGSYCLCDQIQLIADILPMLGGERDITAPKQVIGIKCKCFIKGKRGVDTGSRITLRQRGK